MAFCNTLINICRMEKSESRHVPFLHLQVPDDESIILGTTEHGVLLNFITGLERGGRRTKAKKMNPKNRQEQEKEEQQCH